MKQLIGKRTVSDGAVDMFISLHTIIGASNFDKTMDYASTQSSKCTTSPVQIDKSAYWTRKYIVLDVFAIACRRPFA